MDSSQTTRRREALQNILDLNAQLQLPMPMSIQFSESRNAGGDWPGINLRLDENQRAGVHAWAAHLGIPLEEETDLETGGLAWTQVKASTWSHETPIWGAMYRVDIWCSCDPAEGDARPAQEG